MQWAHTLVLLALFASTSSSVARALGPSVSPGRAASSHQRPSKGASPHEWNKEELASVRQGLRARSRGATPRRLTESDYSYEAKAGDFYTPRQDGKGPQMHVGPLGQLGPSSSPGPTAPIPAPTSLAEFEALVPPDQRHHQLPPLTADEPSCSIVMLSYAAWVKHAGTRGIPPAPSAPPPPSPPAPPPQPPPNPPPSRTRRPPPPRADYYYGDALPDYGDQDDDLSPPTFVRISCSLPDGRPANVSISLGSELLKAHTIQLQGVFVDPAVVKGSEAKVLNEQRLASWPGAWSVSLLFDRMPSLGSSTSKGKRVILRDCLLEGVVQIRSTTFSTGPLIAVFGASTLVVERSTFHTLIDLNGPAVEAVPFSSRATPAQVDAHHASPMESSLALVSSSLTLAIVESSCTASSHVVYGSISDYLGYSVCFGLEHIALSRSGSTSYIASSTFTGLVGTSGPAIGMGDVNSSLVIWNTTLSSNTARIRGGAILMGNVNDAGSVVFASSRLTNNTADAAGAIYAAYILGSLSFTNTLASGNTATNSGGMLRLGQLKGEVVVDASEMSYNTAEYGGVFSVNTNLDGCIIVKNRSLIEGNSAVYGGVLYGGGVDAHEGCFVVANATLVQGNRARDGGGVMFAKVFSGRFECANHSAIVGNTADMGGVLHVSETLLGAVYFTDHCAASNNSAPSDGLGGVIFAASFGSTRTLDGAGRIVLRRSSVALDNYAGSSGGFVYISHFTAGRFDVAGNSLIARNSAGMRGGVVGIGMRTMNYDEIDEQTALEYKYELQSLVTSVLAGDISGEYFSQRGYAGIYVSNGSAISGCCAPSGGAVAHAWNLILPLVVEHASAISNCTARMDSAVVHVPGSVMAPIMVLNHSVIANNAVTYSEQEDSSMTGASYLGISSGSGGVIATTGFNSTLICTGNSAISNNAASHAGGVLYMPTTASSLMGKVIINGSSCMCGNTAGAYGGALHLPSMSMTTTSAVSNDYNNYPKTGVPDTGELDGGNDQYTSTPPADAGGGTADALLSAAAMVVVQGSSAASENSAGRNGGLIFVSEAIEEGCFVLLRTGSEANDNAAGRDGGALFMDRLTGTIALSGGSSLARNSAARIGGAIYIADSIGSRASILLEGGSQLSNNSARVLAGGVYVGASCEGQVVVRDSAVMSGNSADTGGAMLITSLVGNVTLERAVMFGNRALAGAGALSITDLTSTGALRLTHSNVVSNSAQLEGGVITVNNLNGLLLVDNTTAHRNKAAYGGGFISAVSIGGLLRVSGGSSLYGNTASQGSGGALYIKTIQAGAVVQLYDSTLGPGNAAMGTGGSGGAMHIEGIASPSATTSSVGVPTPGGNAVQYRQYLDDGASHSSAVGLVYVRNCTITRNRAASSGGALCISASPNTNTPASSTPARSSSSSAMHPQLKLLLCCASRLEGNSAGLMGGALHLNGSSWLSVNISDVLLARNSVTEGGASGGGGGVALTDMGRGAQQQANTSTSSIASIVRTSFVANLVYGSSSSGSAARGGALLVSDCTAPLHVSDSEFEGNLCIGAGCSGGGLCLQNSWPAHLTGLVFKSNLAHYGAGAYLSGPSSSATSSAGSYTSNSSSGYGGASTTAATAFISPSALVVLEGSQFLNNTAAKVASDAYKAWLTAFASSPSPTAAALHYGSTTELRTGVGAGLSIQGLVSVLVSDCRFLHGAALLGPSVAVNARCWRDGNSSSGTWGSLDAWQQALVLPTAAWNATLTAMARAAVQKACWPVTLLDIATPLASSSSATEGMQRAQITLPQAPKGITALCSGTQSSTASEASPAGVSSNSGQQGPDPGPVSDPSTPAAIPSVAPKPSGSQSPQIAAATPPGLMPKPPANAPTPPSIGDSTSGPPQAKPPKPSAMLHRRLQQGTQAAGSASTSQLSRRLPLITSGPQLSGGDGQTPSSPEDEQSLLDDSVSSFLTDAYAATLTADSATTTTSSDKQAAMTAGNIVSYTLLTQAAQACISTLAGTTAAGGDGPQASGVGGSSGVSTIALLASAAISIELKSVAWTGWTSNYRRAAATSNGGNGSGSGSGSGGGSSGSGSGGRDSDGSNSSSIAASASGRTSNSTKVWKYDLSLNATINVTATMVSFFGATSTEHGTISLSIQLSEVDDSSATATNYLTASTLSASAVNGVFTWTNLTVSAPPGLYRLNMHVPSSSSTTGDDAVSYDDTLLSVSLGSALVRVLPCGVGEVPREDGSCQRCVDNNYNLWLDPGWASIWDAFTPATSSIGSGAAAGESVLGDGKAAAASRSSQQCQNCPAHASCPGGASIVPDAGFWHSAANSTTIHRCPNPSACGQSQALLQACQHVWYTNITAAGITSGVLAIDTQPYCRTAPATTDLTLHNSSPATPAAAPAGSSALRHRRMMLQDPAGSAGAGGSLATGIEQQAGFMFVPYTDAQCSEGYTGMLCAACQPSYYINADFECNKCSPVVRTAWLGILSFLSNVVLVSYAMYATFRDDYTQHSDLGASELLKVIVVHAQYFVIITRLNIRWPRSIHRFQAVLAAVTGSESSLAFSPSCLVPQGGPAWQARSQLLGSLIIPVCVVLLCMVFWIVRWLWFNQGIVKRSGAILLRSTDTMLPSAVKRYVLAKRSSMAGSQRETARSSTQQHTQVESTSHYPNDGAHEDEGSHNKAGLVCDNEEGAQAVSTGAGPAGSAAGDPFSMGGAATSVSGGGESREEYGWRSPGSVMASGEDRQAQALHVTGLGTSSTGAVAEGTEREGQTADAASARDPAPAIGGNDALAEGCGLGSGKAMGGALELEVEHTPSGDEVTHGSATGAAHEISIGPFSSLPQCVPFPSASNRGNVAFSQRNTAPYTQQGSNPSSQHPYNAFSFRSTAAGSDVATEGRGDDDARSDEGSSGRGRSRQGSKQRGLADIIRGGLGKNNRPRHLVALTHLDQALSLPRQLFLVLMVATFILYPGWAAAALSVFACYRIDTGAGLFAENQRAGWRHGYWVRDMTQECYAGVHARLYLPIGVASVLLFCFGPPVTSFLLLWRNRSQLEERHIAQQYGFMYHRYRGMFFFWESVVQIETLALVMVDVFGRTLLTYQQALVLLVVLLTISAINMSCGALRHRLLLTMEFLSLICLALTVALALFFVDNGDTVSRNEAAMDGVGIIIIVMNGLLILFFTVVSVHHARDAIKTRFLVVKEAYVYCKDGTARWWGGRRGVQQPPPPDGQAQKMEQQQQGQSDESGKQAEFGHGKDTPTHEGAAQQQQQVAGCRGWCTTICRRKRRRAN